MIWPTTSDSGDLGCQIGMALLSSTSTSQTPSLWHPTWFGISKPSFSKTPFLGPTKSPKIPSLSIPASTTLRHAPLPWFCCRASSSSDTPSPIKIFIKGLPLSTSEGRLMKVFSEFGEVSQVKLLIDKVSGQSLGFAYIGFVKEESGQLAVKEMNGKFFDGRFIYVRTAKPGSSKSWKRTAPYKF